MNVDALKIELIDWITGLKDPGSINKLLDLKKSLNEEKSKTKKNYGSGKYLIDFVSDDFNDSLEDFNDYKK